MIGQLYGPVLDCAQPGTLARFYCELLGASIVKDEGGWVTIEDGRGRRVSFQRAPEHRPPVFPDPAGSQQMHFDVMVEDIESAERAVLALGATRVDGEGPDFRVYADPAGHPFCLVWET
ncbi:MAG TPA: VOC family protein [Pseudonocardiaceae bacterium]|jgi:catechol 2,3-dioxygenase-like lactoylglutathione lyase family enzyme|nr:VOC family protein [Pseudonocardiaceae bacterium]